MPEALRRVAAAGDLPHDALQWRLSHAVLCEPGAGLPAAEGWPAPPAEGTFLRLAISLPSPYAGGQLSFEYEGTSASSNLAARNKSAGFAAWFAGAHAAAGCSGCCRCAWPHCS